MRRSSPAAKGLAAVNDIGPGERITPQLVPALAIDMGHLALL